MELESNSGKLDLETEFPADSSSPHTIENPGGITGAFVEMALSDKDSYDTAREPTNPSADGSLSSVSRTTNTPSRPPPPRVHYSLPRARQDPPRDVEEVLMNERRIPDPNDNDDDDLDGVVYRSTTTAGMRSESKVYDRVHEIRRHSSSTADFLRNMRIYIGSCGGPPFWIVFYSMLALYPFSMIIVGSVHMHHCKLEPMIPVYMVVAGVFYLIKISFNIYEEALEANKHHGIKQSLQAAIWWRVPSAIVSMFLFAWFIAGCVWVYRAHGNNVRSHQEEIDPLHCQPDLFYFAFWTVTLQIIFIAVGIIATFLLITCLMITSDQQRSRTLQ